MFEWSSGTVFDLTVNGAQARTRGTRDQRMTRVQGESAGLRNFFNISVFSEQQPQLRMGL
jgi:hypothetical protein